MPLDDTLPPRPTPRFRDVLRRAEDQARRRGHHHLGVEHLMLAILDDGRSVATGVLGKLVDLRELQEAMEQVLASEGYGKPSQPREGADAEPRSQSSAVVLVRGDERQRAAIHWTRQARNAPESLFRAQLEWWGEPIEVRAGDMFEALARIRERLDQEGWFVAVQGSRLDAYPTAEQREVSGGLNVHVVRMGEAARPGDTVEMFAEADPSMTLAIAGALGLSLLSPLMSTSTAVAAVQSETRAVQPPDDDGPPLDYFPCNELYDGATMKWRGGWWKCEVVIDGNPKWQ